MSEAKNCAVCGLRYERRRRQAFASWERSKTCSLSCASRSKRTAPLEERFWAKVDKSGECWLWLGSRNEEGYGRIGIGGSGNTAAAHRLSWEMANGQKIPSDLVACHKCDNPPCVNPAHIFIGTKKDNAQDAARKGRTAAQRYPEAFRARMSAVKASGAWKKPPKPCAECARPSKPLRKGLCHACYERRRARAARAKARARLDSLTLIPKTHNATQEQP